MKIILLLTVVLVSLSVQAQVEYGEYEGRKSKEKKNYEPSSEPEERVWQIRNKTDSLEYELYCARFFLEKYRDQIARSRRIIVAGTAITVASLAFAEPSSNVSIAGTALGGTIFLVGGIINWSAGRWLRNVSLRPTNYGASLSISF